VTQPDKARATQSMLRNESVEDTGPKSEEREDKAVEDVEEEDGVVELEVEVEVEVE